MDGIKWIKICTDIFDDEKMLLIESMPDGDGIIVCWFKLLCMAGKQNNSGVFMFNKVAYTDEMLATIFRRPLSLVKKALETFVAFGMVEIVDNVYTIPNWGKHQKTDALEAKTEYMREYMREYREKQKNVVQECKTNSKTNSKTNCNANVSLLDKDIDKDKKENNKKKSFTPPTLDEVQAYAKERGREDLAAAFYDFFTVGNWHDSNGTAVKSWKQKFITWEQHNPKKEPPPQSSPYRKTVECWQGD